MCFLPEGWAVLALCFAFEQFPSSDPWKRIRHRHVVQILLVAHTCIRYLCMKFHCWKVLLLYLPKRRAQSHREKKKSEWRSHREPQRGREFVREHLSVVWWWLFSSKLSANWALPAFWVHVAIFVLESKAHVMNYNRFKELSRNKRGLVRGEEVRRRNVKLCGARQTEEEKKTSSEAPEPLMWTGAESTAPYSAGGAEVSLSDLNKVNTDIWLELKEYYRLLIRLRGQMRSQMVTEA